MTSKRKIMRTRSKHCCAAILLVALLAPPVLASDNAPSGPAIGPVVVQLEPFNVNAVFPAIQVRFVLSGMNLFDPLGDPIQEARVTAVQNEASGDGTSLSRNDELLSLNGTELRGLTIRQIAALVSGARETKTLIWEVRRGLSTLIMRHNGKWETPLPGLAR